MPTTRPDAEEDMDMSDVSQAEAEMEMEQGEGEGSVPATTAEAEEDALGAGVGAGEAEHAGEGEAMATEEEEGASPSPPAAAEGPEPAAPAPARLLITKMEMENFKSYGGLREIGPFHKCFSSIVGPNGSGKSNVIDAMLFVFGKKAKKLRLNKLGELIHRSDTYPNLDFCRVSVHFVDILDVSGSEDDYQEASLHIQQYRRFLFGNRERGSWRLLIRT